MSNITYKIVACNRYYTNAFHQETSYCPGAPKARFDDYETACRRADALQAEFPDFKWEVNKHEGGNVSECVYSPTLARAEALEGKADR